MASKSFAVTENAHHQGVTVFWDGYGLDNERSGVGVFGGRLLEALRMQGVSPIVVPTPHGVISRLKPFAPLICFREAVRIAKNRKTRVRAVYHGLSSFNLPAMLQSTAKQEFAFVLTVHDLIPLKRHSGVSKALRSQMRLLMPLALDRADQIVCISEATYEDLLQFRSSVAAKIKVIPNGFPEVGPVPTPPLAGGPLRLLSIGRFEPYKRLPHMVQIARLFGEGASTTIVTDEVGKGYLGELVKTQALSQNVRILTNQNDDQITALYETTDIYVQPSLYEGYCIPAAQAVAMHVPVLFTKGSAVSETVGPAGVGLPASANPEEWRDALLDMSRRKKEFGAWIQKRLEQRFTWADCARAYRRAYENLVE